MGIIKTQSINSTIYTYLGVIIGFVYSALLFPKFLTTDQNGLLKLLINYSLILSQIGSLGFNNATLKLLPFFKTSDGRHNGFFKLLITVGVAGFCLAMIIFFLLRSTLIKTNIEDSPLLVEYLYYIIPITLVTLFFGSVDTYLRGLAKSTTGAFLKEFVQRIFMLLSICALIFDFVAFEGFVVLYTLSLALPTFILILIVYLGGNIKLSAPIRLPLNVTKSDLASVSRYGLITGFSIIAISNIDGIMINQYLDTSFTGIYSITSYFAILIMIPSRSFLRIGAPVIASAFKDNDLEKVNIIYYKSCLNQFIFAILLFAGLWANIDNVFKILPADYEPGKYVIFYIGISSIITMLSGSSTAIIANSKYYRYNAYFTFSLVAITIVTNIIFIPMLGITGAALASVVSIFIFNLLKYVFIYQKFGFQPYDKKYLIAAIIGLVTISGIALIPVIPNLYLDILIRGTVTIASIGGLVYFLKISEDINQIISKIIQFILRT